MINMITAEEARRICDKARIPPSKLEFFDLIENISDKIELAAAAGCSQIELSFTSIGIWCSNVKSVDLKEFLKENGYEVEVIPDGPYSDVEFVISW